MIEWAGVAWKVRPIAVEQAKRWWNRDEAKNLNRRVLDQLEGDKQLAKGIREELVWEWMSVREDVVLERLVAQLLRDPDPELSLIHI